MSRKGQESFGEGGSVFRVPPYHYIHVQDQTSNVTRVEVGPLTFVRKDNEKVVAGPAKMIIVPPRHYCIVHNPVVRSKPKEEGQFLGELQFDSMGQIRLQHAEKEVRLAQDPFPLYPGEEAEAVKQLTVVPAMQALRLKAVRDFEDEEDNVKRIAGDEFLFEGPGTYIPRREVEVVTTITATVILQNEALRLRANRATTDRDGKNRVAGEEWMVRKVGAYLPGAHETVVRKCSAYVLTDQSAVHVMAKKTFTDQLGIKRKNGEEYLITLNEMECFIPDVYEEVVGSVIITTLTDRQYCAVLNPIGSDGKPQLGHRKIIKGEKSFFLQPGEQLECGIQDVYILGEDEGIVLKSLAEYEDKQVSPSVHRKPGDTWMLKGPMEYIPTVEVEVVQTREAIPLHENEGIYVRNIKSGGVRAVIGHTYMLKEDEELWEKPMNSMVRCLLDKNRDPTADRGNWINQGKLDKQKRQGRDISQQSSKRFKGAMDDDEETSDATRVITFQIPNNAAVQIYDYKSKRSRVVFGPDLVMLEPNEEFTRMSLSAGKPKKANMIMTLALLLGPDFCTDIITVETSDHARLQLQLSYNWHFDVAGKKEDKDEAAKLFCVSDFIGDMCKAIGSRIRGAVSSVSFDDFHKNSARIIKVAVFGVDEGKRTANEELRFAANNLVVTSIDIQSVEPIDQKTRDSLQKSVTLAIEITTQSQEATAKREAERVDQEARGRLERQRISDEAEAEKTRKNLLILQAESAAVESTGQAKAEAQSRAESARIESEAAVEAAKLKVEAARIESDAELERLLKAREAEINFLTEQNRLEVSKAQEMASIEINRFKSTVDALGSDTIRAIASGPQDHQVKMLQSLGLSSTLITDGRTPINLLNTAKGLFGGINDGTNLALGDRKE